MAQVSRYVSHRDIRYRDNTSGCMVCCIAWCIGEFMVVVYFGKLMLVNVLVGIVLEI